MFVNQLDDLHCRVCRLEEKFLVDVNMDKETYNVRKHEHVSGFVAGCLFGSMNGQQIELYTVFALSAKGITLDFLNEQLKTADSKLCTQLHEFTGIDPVAGSLRISDDFGFIPVQMQACPALRYSFVDKTHNFFFGYVRHVI